MMTAKQKSTDKIDLHGYINKKTYSDFIDTIKKLEDGKTSRKISKHVEKALKEYTDKYGEKESN